MQGKPLAEMFNIVCPDGIDTAKPVLIVEHAQDMRLIVVHHLGKLGFSNIVQVSDAHVAFNLLSEMREKSEIQAVICDQDLPLVNGLDFLQELRENPEYDRPPFTLSMDSPSKEKIMYALETGVDEVLVKPYTLNDIFPRLLEAFNKFHNPNNPEKVYEYAKQFYREEDFEKSKMVYKTIAAETKASARPYVGIARCLDKMGDLDGAHKALDQAERENPNFVHLFSVRGEFYAMQGELDKALQAFRTAIDLSPLNPLRFVRLDTSESKTLITGALCNNCL